MDLIGTVWRKDGPGDWLRVVDTSFCGDGLSGVSVQFRSHTGRWLKERWFCLCANEETFVAQQAASCRYLREAVGNDE